MGASTANTSPNMYSGAAKPRLGPGHPRTSLWNIGVGFKFASDAEAPPLYPTLDFKRFFHSHETTAITSDDDLPSKAAQPSKLLKELTVAPVTQDEEHRAILSAAVAVTSIVETTSTGTSTTDTQPTVDQSDLPAEESQPAVEPPVTSLDFNISKELFETALSQPKDSPGSFWSHTMYRRTSADGTTQNVTVHYCTSKSTMEYICQRHFLNEPVLGFDLEWMPYAKRGGGPRENVSLIQLASPGRIGLFHVAVFPRDDFVAPTFRAIMEDAAVAKAGVHIQADCTRLRNFLGVKAEGVFELSHLYKQVKYAGDAQTRRLVNKVPVALATQVQDVLKLPLFKGESVRGSDWSKSLTSDQIKYSAADAYAGLQLYHVLDERRLAMDPSPDRPRHVELGLPIPIPPTPVVSDVESDPDSDAESITDSSSEFSDGSIEEAMLELAIAESSRISTQSPDTTVNA